MEREAVVEMNAGTLVELANGSRHIETTTEHVAAMIDAPHVDLVIAIWSDPTEPGGVATWIVKGRDLLESIVNKRRRRRCVSQVTFWLRNEEHANALNEEIAQLVEKATGARGEFLPIEDDLAFEVVPDTEIMEEFYVTKGGACIARRGRPGTRERKRWISLLPDYSVRDINKNQVEIQYGRASIFFGQPN
jgi:hypothetical protein